MDAHGRTTPVFVPGWCEATRTFNLRIRSADWLLPLPHRVEVAAESLGKGSAVWAVFSHDHRPLPNVAQLLLPARCPAHAPALLTPPFPGKSHRGPLPSNCHLASHVPSSQPVMASLFSLAALFFLALPSRASAVVKRPIALLLVAFHPAFRRCQLLASQAVFTLFH
ncbi:hypothetical protein VDGL01_11335 [Verticillium dahliae]